MLSKQEETQVSKTISYLLRHKKGYTDDTGWVDIDILLIDLNMGPFVVSREDLDHIVKTDKKGRYLTDGNMISAAQGHSTGINIHQTELKPPDTLYHGTASRFVESIKQNGIVSMNRDYVHLSSDINTAFTVGERHGSPIVILIDSKKAYLDGKKFYLSKNGVWLTSSMESKYLVGFVRKPKEGE